MAPQLLKDVKAILAKKNIRLMWRLIILISNKLCRHTFSFYKRATSMSYIYRD